MWPNLPNPSGPGPNPNRLKVGTQPWGISHLRPPASQTPSPLSVCAITLSLPLSSFLPFTLVVNRSEPFLKKSKPPYSSHTNPHGRRRADRLHGATSHWPTANLKPISCCPSLTAPRSVPLRSFGRNLDVYRIDQFYCVHFLPYFDLDLPTLHSMFSPLALDFIL